MTSGLYPYQQMALDAILSDRGKGLDLWEAAAQSAFRDRLRAMREMSAFLDGVETYDYAKASMDHVRPIFASPPCEPFAKVHTSSYTEFKRLYLGEPWDDDAFHVYRQSGTGPTLVAWDEVKAPRAFDTAELKRRVMNDHARGLFERKSASPKSSIGRQLADAEAALQRMLAWGRR